MTEIPHETTVRLAVEGLFATTKGPDRKGRGRIGSSPTWSSGVRHCAMPGSPVDS